MTRPLAILVTCATLIAPLRSARPQEQTFALRPASTNVTVTKDVEYGRSDTIALRMDVYRPAESSAPSAYDIAGVPGCAQYAEACGELEKLKGKGEVSLTRMPSPRSLQRQF